MSRCRISRMAQVALPLICFCSTEARAVPQAWNLSLLGEAPGAYQAVHVVGRYAYMGGHDSRYEGIFRILDVANPASPLELGSFGPHPWVMGVHVRDGSAYLADGSGGLQVVDVANPSSPTLRGSYPTRGSTHRAVASGRFAYLAEAQLGLKIVDVTDPSSPTLRGSYDTPDAAVDLSVSNGLVFIADLSSLLIVDVTDPSSPTLRGSYQNPSWGRLCNVFVSNGMAYVTATAGDYWTGYYAWFLTLDVTNPALPRLLGSYGTPGVAGGVYVSNGLAHVCLGNGLRIFNVGTPSSPVLRGFYPVDFLSWGYGQVFVTGNLAYVAGNRQGLLILRYTGPPAAASRWRMYR